MEPYTCYPYSYGDKGGSFNFSHKRTKFLLIALFSCTTLVSLPMFSSAADAEVILRRIEDAIKELNGTKKYTRGISPVGGVSCIISGICISQAKISLQAGNIPASAAFACGAAIALCGDRIAAANGL